MGCVPLIIELPYKHPSTMFEHRDRLQIERRPAPRKAMSISGRVNYVPKGAMRRGNGGKIFGNASPVEASTESSHQPSGDQDLAFAALLASDRVPFPCSAAPATRRRSSGLFHTFFMQPPRLPIIDDGLVTAA
jgi:hypothetical protein